MDSTTDVFQYPEHRTDLHHGDDAIRFVDTGRTDGTMVSAHLFTNGDIDGENCHMGRFDSWG